jgi:dynein heavy chain
MNEVRKEAEENAYLLGLAEKDKGRLKMYIRLVDYMSIETLVFTNFVSMNMLLEEMKKERKQGLFNTTVNFDVQQFTPDENEIKESIMTLLDDMIVVMRNTVRIISHQSLEPFVKSMSSMD